MDDLLIVVLCLAPLAVGGLIRGRTPAERRRLAALGMGLAFCFFALGHVAIHDRMVRMLPEWLPGRSPLVHATGALEVLIAAGLMSPRWQRVAARAAMVVLVLFFPANVYAAFAGTWDVPGQEGPGYLWIRAPLQLFLLAWAAWPAFGGQDGGGDPAERPVRDDRTNKETAA